MKTYIMSDNTDLQELLSQHGEGEYEVVSDGIGGAVRIVDEPAGEGVEVVRPYHLSELFDAIENAKISSNGDDEVEIGEFIFSSSKAVLVLGEEEIDLTDKEVGIISTLIDASPNSVSKQELLQEVWDYGSGVDTNTLETHIYRLRKKLGKENDFIITDKDGYRV